jgi:undecaprenyl pyrophosphate phosphatase UppP
MNLLGFFLAIAFGLMSISGLVASIRFQSFGAFIVLCLVPGVLALLCGVLLAKDVKRSRDKK